MFNHIIGQDTAVKALRNIIAHDQVRGSYLFLGPDGVGKRTTAIAFAKAINCEREGGHQDCDCVSCNKIASLNHPDVFVVSPEGASGSIKIEKIREIIYQASLKPYEGKKRAFIIVDAEAMTEEAQSALLKLLEEPPKNHILILTSSNISGLFPTVFSRCRVLKFSFLSKAMILEFLLSINIEEKEAMLFSHMAMGSLGRAITFKETCIIAQRDKLINDFFLRKSALLREDVLTEDTKGDVEESLYILLCWYRDILVSKFTQDRQFLLNIDRTEEVLSYAGKFSREKLESDISAIMKTIEYVRRNVNPKSALFNMAVGLKRAEKQTM